MVLIAVATPLEAAILRRELGANPSVQIVETGVGPVSAAHGVTVAVLERRPAVILSCGIAGAYRGSGIGIGEVVCADVEIYGDLGAQSPSGFLDMRQLGFPVVSGPAPLFNELPLQVFPLDRRVRSVTVSTCTGTERSASEIQARTGGHIENMEGAAVAHVAHLHGIPVAEIRAISNIVTDRDKSQWRLKDASEASQEAAIRWVRTLGLEPATARP